VAVNKGQMVGCIENWLPSTKYGNPLVLKQNSFLVQMFDQMTEVSNYYGTVPIIGIGRYTVSINASTGREWRFFQLVGESQEPFNNVEDMNLDASFVLSSGNSVPKSVTEGSMRSPSLSLTSSSAKGIVLASSKKIRATRIFKWNEPEMLFALGSVLKTMIASRR
jgi:hypothetical protein